jgi:hypothetical protein
VRITGTFSYISGFGSFMFFYPFLMWALIRLNYSLWFVGLGISFGFVAALMTGGRGPVLVYITYTAVIMLVLYSLKDIGTIFARLFFPALIILGIVLAYGETPLRKQVVKAYENFMDRLERGRESGEQQKRLTWDLDYLKNLNRYPNIVTGIGLGATYQGAVILFGRSQYVTKFGYVEGEFIKMLLEGGIVYIVLRIILATIVVLSLSFQHPVLRLLIWFSLVYAIPIVFNVHNAAFLLISIILVDNIVWRQSLKASQTIMPNNVPEKGPSKIIGKGYPQIGDPIPQ